MSEPGEADENGGPAGTPPTPDEGSVLPEPVLKPPLPVDDNIAWAGLSEFLRQPKWKMAPPQEELQVRLEGGLFEAAAPASAIAEILHRVSTLFRALVIERSGGPLSKTRPIPMLPGIGDLGVTRLSPANSALLGLAPTSQTSRPSPRPEARAAIDELLSLIRMVSNPENLIYVELFERDDRVAGEYVALLKAISDSGADTVWFQRGGGRALVPAAAARLGHAYAAPEEEYLIGEEAIRARLYMANADSLTFRIKPLSGGSYIGGQFEKSLLPEVRSALGTVVIAVVRHAEVRFPWAASGRQKFELIEIREDTGDEGSLEVEGDSPADTETPPSGSAGHQEDG